MVLSKPAGLLSQGEITGDENLVDWLRAYFGRNYVGLVHRLDRNTSGLMVVAKRSKSADRLSDSLRKGKLKRSYLALIQGDLKEAQTWKDYLEKNEATNIVRVVRSGAKAKEAILNLRPVEKKTIDGISVTLAQYELQTGRSHQIRVQSAHHGFPLIGDRKYGESHGLDLNFLDFGRPALHSSEISFPHPMSNEPMHFEDTLPADMKSLLSKGSEGLSKGSEGLSKSL